MANVFGILTAIVLAIALFVGFKNKSQQQTEINNTQDAQTALETVQRKEDLAQTNLAAANKDIDEVKAKIPDATARGAEQKKINDELTLAKTTKTQEVEANKTKLDQVREKTNALGNIRDLATKMQETSKQVADFDVSLQSSEAKLASLTVENNRLDAQVNEQKKQVDLRSKGESFSSLQTHISAVYPNWGFVTLAAGNNSGVIMNSPLNVVRDGEVVASLLVTAVERNTASASIVPDSLKADTVLSAGDEVVPGVKAATNTTATPTSASQPVKPAPAR
jgi:hypothetical protein